MLRFTRQRRVHRAGVYLLNKIARTRLLSSTSSTGSIHYPSACALNAFAPHNAAISTSAQTMPRSLSMAVGCINTGRQENKCSTSQKHTLLYRGFTTESRPQASNNPKQEDNTQKASKRSHEEDGSNKPAGKKEKQTASESATMSADPTPRKLFSDEELEKIFSGHASTVDATLSEALAELRLDIDEMEALELEIKRQDRRRAYEFVPPTPAEELEYKPVDIYHPPPLDHIPPEYRQKALESFTRFEEERFLDRQDAGLPVLPDDAAPESRLPDLELVDTSEPVHTQAHGLLFDQQRMLVPMTYFQLSDKEIKELLPEGPSGMLKKEFEQLGRNRFLFRTQAQNILEELQARHSTRWSTPESKLPYVLTGPAGSGKSALLSQIVMWCRRNGWIVFFLPDGANAVSEGILRLSAAFGKGVYEQPELSQTLLQKFYAAHKDKLSKLPLKTRFSPLGSPEASDAGEPVEYFDPTPNQTLADLVKFGADSYRWAATVLFLIRKELSLITEYPVLIAVDDINAFYRRSGFADPASLKFKQPPLHAQFLAVSRLFRDHTDHGLLNGTVVAATTGAVPSTEYFQQSGRKKLVDVPRYSYEEFNKVVEHYQYCSWLADPLPVPTVKYIYQLCGGIGAEIWKYSYTLSAVPPTQ